MFLAFQESDGGLADYVTDEELELCQTIQPTSKVDNSTVEVDMSKSAESLHIVDTDKFEVQNTETSPSHKEVLIGGDNNPSRR